jgi:hypothetical protein
MDETQNPKKARVPYNSGSHGMRQNNKRRNNSALQRKVFSTRAC